MFSLCFGPFLLPIPTPDFCLYISLTIQHDLFQPHPIFFHDFIHSFLNSLDLYFFFLPLSFKCPPFSSILLLYKKLSQLFSTYVHLYIVFLPWFYNTRNCMSSQFDSLFSPFTSNHFKGFCSNDKLNQIVVVKVIRFIYELN